MDEDDGEHLDPREEIALLEQRIEQLAAKIESCRKFMLAARVAIALGGAFLAVILFRLIRADAMMTAAAMTAVLGGSVVLGSNSSTARDASAQITAAEARRAELIGRIDLRDVSAPRTLH